MRVTAVIEHIELVIIRTVVMTRISCYVGKAVMVKVRIQQILSIILENSLEQIRIAVHGELFPICAAVSVQLNEFGPVRMHPRVIETVVGHITTERLTVIRITMVLEEIEQIIVRLASSECRLCSVMIENAIVTIRGGNQV